MNIDSHLLLDSLRQFKSTNPVRPEGIGSRDLDFSTYVRKYCRPSKTGLLIDGLELGAFTANDLDWVVNDYRNNTLRLLEIKTRGATFGFPQTKLWSLLDNMLRVGSMHMHEYGLGPVRYGGLAVLRLQNTTPGNSAWVKWMDRDLARSYTNWREYDITREEAWRRLNMLDMLEGAA